MEEVVLSHLDGAREQDWRNPRVPVLALDSCLNHLPHVYTQTPASNDAEIINVGVWPESGRIDLPPQGI